MRKCGTEDYQKVIPTTIYEATLNRRYLRSSTAWSGHDCLLVASVEENIGSYAGDFSESSREGATLPLDGE